MLGVCYFATSLGPNYSTVLGEHRSDLTDTLYALLTAKTLKLPETKNWLLQEELKIPYKSYCDIEYA